MEKLSSMFNRSAKCELCIYNIKYMHLYRDIFKVTRSNTTMNQNRPTCETNTFPLLINVEADLHKKPWFS